MKLVPASSPGMEAAHKNFQVRTIVDTLLIDHNLLRPVAMFLKKYSSGDQPGFEEALDALSLFQSRSDITGSVAPPEYVTTLIRALRQLYHQKGQSINYQRGAIVEALVCKLICYRYCEPGELCLNNQRFEENHRPITVQEVDVAALSISRKKLEGYECKVSSASFASFDSINLSDLAEEANERQYRVNVGFVAFENDKIMKIKLAKFQLPACINIYSIDNIEILQQLSFLEH
ncbi:hypothetical protein EPA93_32480 [Ktedonosporobacter rubrisoli]|uniref:Uncharacterized protein n=1 Tax=Ktedonosporobacter rubrisoli TaxID=2509675 RepID=A0A4P6JXG3_KTERU|nr:hypothetical protein [Ktedonosporobacter rubrisoli]QBD80438.1 hypothetical protein EPA93_32480 [Ktedonosporobacter rubrisoli]